jgi:hypothetical protein
MQQHTSPPARTDHRPWRLIGLRAQALIVAVITALGITTLGAGSAFAAETPGTVSGTFTVPAGTGDPSDVNVELIDANGYAGYATVTDSTTTPGEASYTFSHTPGQYYVYFTDSSDASYGSTPADNVEPDYYGDNGADNIHAAASVTITSGGSTALNNVALHGGAVISGTVTDANSGTEGDENVYLQQVNAGAAPDPELYPDWDVYSTDPSNYGLPGSEPYQIGGLPAGTYQVEYSADASNFSLANAWLGSGGLSYDGQTATQFSIAAGSSTTINVPVPALAKISGTVSDSSGPLNDVEVHAVDGLQQGEGYTDTAGDGTYSMTLLPGNYKVEVSEDTNANLATAWYGGATFASAGNVQAGAGATASNINVTLGAGGTISGTVTSGQGGAALGGIEVDLYDAQDNYVTDAVTLPNGTYTMSDVPAGTWYVEFDGGFADSGTLYAGEFLGGTQSEFGAQALTIAAGQTVTGINGVLLPQSTSALGLPTESGAALSGLNKNKVSLKFKVAAGADAGYLHTLTIALPKGFSWKASKFGADLSLGTGGAYTDTITNGALVITLTTPAPSASVVFKPGAITVSKSIEKAAGGTTTKTKKKKKKKHSLATAAKAKKKKKTSKDTIQSELIHLTVGDTTGIATALPITINKPK